MPSLDLGSGCYTDFEVVEIMNPRARYMKNPEYSSKEQLPKLSEAAFECNTTSSDLVRCFTSPARLEFTPEVTGSIPVSPTQVRGWLVSSALFAWIDHVTRHLGG
jgi:hypothetical protein